MEQSTKNPCTAMASTDDARAVFWWLAFTSCVVAIAITLPLMLASLWIQPHVQNQGLITLTFVGAIVTLRVLESWRKAWR